MFKKWLGYLGGRSFEIIILFSVLYSFITLIDRSFNDLLSFRTCIESYLLPIAPLKILRSYVDNRSLTQWLIMYVMIAGLTFILNLIIDKIPDVTGVLFVVNIGGEKVRADGTPPSAIAVESHGNGAAGIMSAVRSAAMAAASGAFSAAGYAAGKGMEFGRGVMRATGASQALGNMFSGFPISSPGTIYNNMKIDSAISQGQKEAAAKGLTGKEADSYARQASNNILQNQMLPKDLNNSAQSDSMRNTYAMTGLDSQAIQARMEQKMVQEPLKDFLKEEAKRLKNQDPDKIPLGKDMREQLRTNAMAWAEKNLVGGAAAVEKYLGKEGRDAGKAGGSAFAVAARDINNVLKSSAELSTAEAAKRFAGSPSLQNKFLQHLQERDFKRNLRNSEAQASINLSSSSDKSILGQTANAMRNAVDVTANVLGKKAPNLASRALDGLIRSEARNPKMAQESFERNLRNVERWDSGSATQKALWLNPFNRSNTLNRAMDMLFGGKSTLSDRTDAARTKALVNLLKGDAKKVTPKTDLPKDKKAAEKKNEKDAQRKEFFQSQLRENATKDLAKELAQIQRLETLGKISETTRIDKISERIGWATQSQQAQKAKEEMLSRVQSEIEFKDDKIIAKNGTLFEVAAKLDYLHRELGIPGESTQKLMLEALKNEAAINAKRVEEAIGSAKKPQDLEEAKKDAKNLAELKTGLFGSEIKISNADAEPYKAIKNHLEKFKNYKLTGEEQKKTSPDEDKNKDAENDKDINKEKTETQDRLDQINKALLEKEEALKKEGAEGIAKAEKETKEKEAREKALNDMMDKMTEIQKMEKDIAEKSSPSLEDNKALEEARQQLQKMIEPALEASQAINDKINSKAEEMDALLQKRKNEIDEAKAKQDDAKLQEVLKNVKVETDGFIATVMKIEFGASISDILMKAPDVGLHAGSILLGSNDKGDKPDKSAQINSTKISLNMAQGKLKMQTMDKKMKEFELSKLKDAGGDKDAISKLEAEVRDLETGVAQSQASVERVEKEMGELQKD